ncbi:MAG: cytochrome c3 family protein [Deltaproteobacteria bacterium]|nr:MAG: cytochrome c3 family protein [Deltaproteobacteria bacterium]
MRKRILPFSETRVLLSIAAVLFCISCVYLFTKSDALIFSHKLHMAEGADCTTCHEGITESAYLTGRHLPSEQSCGSCHDEGFMKACDKCHTNPDDPQKVGQELAEINFSHKAHLAENKDCAVCHVRTAKSVTVREIASPGHQECAPCHQETYSKLDCSTCHESLKTVISFAHEGNWVGEHQETASTNMTVCTQCHDQSFCADCHSRQEELVPSIKYPEAVERNFIHRGDYLTRHSIEARVDQTLCLKCHGISSCNECHGQRRGGPADHYPLTEWKNSAHGTVSRLNLMRCASCHDKGAETNCINCHKVGQPGGSPHPSGWKSELSKTRDAVCLLCH